MSKYRAPGVHVEEVTPSPPPVTMKRTAVPLFVGYTAQQPVGNAPTVVHSYPEFCRHFGIGNDITVHYVRLSADLTVEQVDLTVTHYLHPSLHLFYANGGGRCYVKSLGTAAADGTLPPRTDADLTPALFAELAACAEATILVFPDHPGSAGYDQVLRHCALQPNRIAVLDVAADDYTGGRLRSHVGDAGLSYGAAYTPWLRCRLPMRLAAHRLGETVFTLPDGTRHTGLTPELLPDATAAAIGAATSQVAGPLRDAAQSDLSNTSAIYRGILSGIAGADILLPPSGAVVGAYERVDVTKGLWKAPANIDLRSVIAPDRRFSPAELDDLHIPASGKSINAIRYFAGRGTLIWGARTLGGNDGMYRYVNIRRLVNSIEETCGRACDYFRHEPNNARTWLRVTAMIENFLVIMWRSGALQGRKAEEAFFVFAEPGRTMAEKDLTENRLIVEVGIAPIRPAEFEILRVMRQLSPP